MSLDQVSVLVVAVDFVYNVQPINTAYISRTNCNYIYTLIMKCSQVQWRDKLLQYNPCHPEDTLRL